MRERSFPKSLKNIWDTALKDKHFHILFVCTGNLCRSPMAEGILRDMLDQAGIAHVSVSSAGTWATDGTPVADYAELVARSHGVDISLHRARKWNADIIDEADLILVMEDAQADSIRKNYPSASGRLFAIKEFGPDAPGGEVEDPMSSGLEVYQTCYEELRFELDRIFPEIRKRIARKRSVFSFLHKP